VGGEKEVEVEKRSKDDGRRKNQISSLFSPSPLSPLYPTLRFSSCSSLCLWNGVFLAWSLKFIVLGLVGEGGREEEEAMACFNRSTKASEIECFFFFSF